MRSIGKIKWVGGYSYKCEKELDYGFIKIQNNDVWFNIKNILKGNHLKEGDYVSFKLKFNENNNTCSAYEIQLLDIENYIRDIGLLDINQQSEILYNSLDFLKNEISGFYQLSENNYEKLLKMVSIQHLFINKSFQNILDLKTIINILGKDYDSGTENNNLLNELLIDYDINILNKFYKDIPSEILKNNFELFNKLDYPNKIEYIVNYIINNPVDESIMLKITSFHDDFLKPLEGKLWNVINAENIDHIFLVKKFKDLNLWNKLSLNFKYELLRQCSIKDIVEEDFHLASDAFKYAGIMEQRRYIEKFGLTELRNYDMMQFINPYDKQELFFNKKIEWIELCSDSKILSIYRLAKENRDFSFLREYKDSIIEDKIVHALCKILFCKSMKNESKKQIAFVEAHNLIQDFVVEKAWNLDEEIDLSLVLPICKVDNTCKDEDYRYCDCREWIRIDKETNQSYLTSYCPRKYEYKEHSCNEFLANLDLEYYEWSLKELLAYSKVIPCKVEGLSKPNEYVNKLGGWINRLNSIRERLKCSKCYTPFKPNLKYAKHLAKFTTTVLSCTYEDKINHDKDIYFNQCWHCKRIIDSRESSIYVDKYYLCIHCGAGPINNVGYMQGSKCPKCGSAHMYNNINNKFIFTCHDCNHSINTSKY